jgi:hypothetical protein
MGNSLACCEKRDKKELINVEEEKKYYASSFLEED